MLGSNEGHLQIGVVGAGNSTRHHHVDVNAFSGHADSHGNLAPLRRLLAQLGIEIRDDGFDRRAEMGVAIKNLDAVAHVSLPFYLVLSLGKPKASTAIAIHLLEL